MTEAKAVAAIAEWRARSLESAATVPWPEGRAVEEIDNETAAPGAPAEESGEEPEGVDE
jgi:hypothetical protein